MSLTAPSGAVFNNDDLRLIKQLGEIGFIKYSEKPFKLKSGVMSNVYVYGREELTANPHILWSLGRKILRDAVAVMKKENDERKPCFIGYPTAGTPLAQAAAMVDVIECYSKNPATFYQMRSVKKQSHGAHETWIVGKPNVMEERIFRTDNVTTDGGTKIEWAPRFAEDGLPTYDLDDIIVVERQQGALKRMAEAGFKKKPVVIYYLLDLTFVFRELEVWPAQAVAQVEKEIAEHQFK